MRNAPAAPRSWDGRELGIGDRNEFCLTDSSLLKSQPRATQYRNVRGDLPIRLEYSTVLLSVELRRLQMSQLGPLA
jgi:hypothetical protein